MESWEGAELNKAKEILAYELTTLVHGKEEALKAQEAARALFSKGVAENMPETVLKESDFNENGQIDISGLLVSAGLAGSRSEGRRAVEQGGVAINDDKITDFKTVFDKDFFAGDGIVLKKGKKNFRKVTLG